MTVLHEAYKTKVLDPAVHDRLVADIDNIARDANVSPMAIWTKLDPGLVSADALDWVRKYKFHRGNKCSGLAFVGDSKYAVEDRMEAIAGALLRNFIDAKVMTANEVIEASDRGGVESSCLLIPNFFTGDLKSGKDQQAAWRVAGLLDTLLSRHMAGRMTVIHVADMAQLALAYGKPMAKHIENHYRVVNG